MTRAARLVILTAILLVTVKAAAQDARRALTEGIYTESVVGDLNKTRE